MKDTRFSPKEFLKNRRPERFSDSVILEKNILDRSVLEHHLASLNKRNQELIFEDYAKRICEKVICPNLLAQTGPVAGGDGKVDTQTFPVSEQNQLMWYEGFNDSSQKERWAFAVSTRVDWKVKCREDIRKIKGTDRGYVKAFFITNQYAKSNQRSDVEDALKKETDIDVRVLDISWLLDQTLKNGHEDIAIETLSLTPAKVSENTLGPNDYRKVLELETILEKIKNEVNPQKILTHQVEMFLEAAILSKELEKGELETQGLFDRAIRISSKFGTNMQKFDAFYEYAWASHWWFEDFSLFEDNLEKAFECIVDSTNSSKWEKFVTLITVFQGHALTTKEKTSIDFESIKLKTNKQLALIADDDSRPSNSLQARTSLLLLELFDIQKQPDVRTILNDLLVVAKECDKLVGYPFDSFFDLISEIDLAFGDFEEYEALLDHLTEQSSVRHGEVQSSLTLLRRGIKRLDSGKPYQTIKLVGKSLLGLYKHESRKDIVIALKVISFAYTKIGLLWAARGSLLLAASLITDDFWRTDEINSAQVKVYLRLAWLEIQLGRICHALTWFRLALLIDNNLEESIIDEKEFVNFDGYLSHCLLRADLSIIKSLEKLPDLLDKLGLFNSHAMLLYCLGYENLVAEEIEVDINEEFIDFLLLVRDYDFDVKNRNLNTFTGRWNEITSSVLGCNITITFPLRSPLVELAESILSVIEGFCSTGIIDKIYTVESDIKINISADDDEEIEISHEIDDTDSIIVFNVFCSSFTPSMLNLDGQKEIQKWLQRFIFDVYFRIIMITDDTKEKIESSLMNDNALERSISFSACFTTVYNVLGNNATKEISTLLESSNDKVYSITRTINWDSDYPCVPSKKSHLELDKSDNNTHPKELFNNEQLSHDDIRTNGLIKTRLWDKAKWNGTGFVIYPDGFPLISLIFKDEKAANSIFSNLFSELGVRDPLNRLRISIIRKISTKEPFNYRVCITENPQHGEAKFVTMVTRTNTMTPSDDINLSRFLTAYQQNGYFGFNYSILRGNQYTPPINLDKLTIVKSKLIIKDAWEVGSDDFERMCIKAGDTPIIPEHIKLAPVTELLSSLQSEE